MDVQTAINEINAAMKIVSDREKFLKRTREKCPHSFTVENTTTITRSNKTTSIVTQRCNKCKYVRKIMETRAGGSIVTMHTVPSNKYYSSRQQ